MLRIFRGERRPGAGAGAADAATDRQPAAGVAPARAEGAPQEQGQAQAETTTQPAQAPAQRPAGEQAHTPQAGPHAQQAQVETATHAAPPAQAQARTLPPAGEQAHAQAWQHAQPVQAQAQAQAQTAHLTQVAQAQPPAVEQAQEPLPQAPRPPADPGFLQRGRMRRRARFLRAARELAYRDLGGLVFDRHRFGAGNDGALAVKIATLERIDTELRALEDALRAPKPLSVLREAGVAACPRCAAIHGSGDRFCPACGMSVDETERPIAGAAAAPAAAWQAAPGPVPAPAGPTPATPPGPPHGSDGIASAPAHASHPDTPGSQQERRAYPQTIMRAAPSQLPLPQAAPGTSANIGAAEPVAPRDARPADAPLDTREEQPTQVVSAGLDPGQDDDRGGARRASESAAEHDRTRSFETLSATSRPGESERARET